MSPLMTLLAFMFPILTVASQALNGNNLYTLFPPSPVGDVLNVTKCFCESRNPLSPDATFGYYYLVVYFNYHLNRTYSVTADCTSPAPGNTNGTKAAKCMGHVSKHEKLCDDSPDGNKFCFKLKESVNNVGYSEPSASKYSFNQQKRRVPGQPSETLEISNVTQNCGFYCDEELGGLMTSQTPSSFIPGVGLVANSIVSYTDLDDMCFTCA